MRPSCFLVLAWVAAVCAARASEAQRPGDLLLATTTSVRDAGLLDEILPTFEARTGIQVRVVAVGSGQAMALGRRGEADILILHDPEGEERFVAEGYGVDRRALMTNAFVIAGPPEDPARIRRAAAVDAMRLIAAARARFASRGDRSGTHTREVTLWTIVGIEPEGDWYLETGQGMGATLVVADQVGAYVLTDIGTLLAHRAALRLEILVEGDPALVNPYHVVRASAERFPRVNEAGAIRLAEYLLSDEVQRRIGEFRVAEFGRPLFQPARAH